MDPNNIPPPNPPSNQPIPGNINSGQFDFIMNPQTPPKKSFLPSNPKIKMLVIGLGIITIVVILLAVILSIFSSGDSSTETLVKISQQQNEIIRISNDGKTKAGGEKAKKLATMTNMTVTTDQSNLLNYLSKQKRKVKPKELKLLTDAKADKELVAASSNGRYDEVFTQIIIEKLNEYQKSLQGTFNNVGPKGKEVIKQSYDNTTLIIKDNSKTSP